MKGKKHNSAGQIIRQLEEAEVRLSAGQTLAQVCPALEVAESTCHRWRNQYGGMKAEEAKRLKEREKENSRLKQMGADLLLDKALLTDIARGNF